MNKLIGRILLLSIGFGLSCFIIVHLLLIMFYGNVIIYESNKLILYQEVITMAIIVVGYLYQIKTEFALGDKQ